MSPVSDEQAKPGTLLAREKTPQSRNSPGIVKDGETLARMVFRPPHVGDDERIHYQFITTRDLRGGCSFDRKDICGAADIDKRGADRARDAGREYIGYAEAKAGQIREITDASGMRALCVLDDATEDNPAHAIVKITRKDYDRGAIREIRKKLFNHLKRDSARVIAAML